MGLRYRKSINLGGGFRVNVSKNGIGYSWGVKGARITKTAKGTTRATVSVPGTGISYVEETGKRKGGNPTGNHQENNGFSETLPSQSTEIINVGEYQPVEYKDLLDNIKKIQMLNLVSTILIWTFILAAIPLFIFTGIVGVALKIFIHSRLAIPMEYEFDEESKQAYDNLCAVWMSMNENSKFWQTISESQLNQKVSGGASRGVKRIPAKAIKKMPYYLKANVQPFGLKLRKQQLFFLPDKLLVVSGIKVGAVNYSDMSMGLGTTRFVETDPVPKDARVIGQTWLKVNKDGTPDKRFNGNRQIPVCEYGLIQIKSGQVLNVELMCSSSATVDKMRGTAQKVFKA